MNPALVSARRLAALALVLGLLLPLASLPPFALGYWDKAEPLVVGLHAVAALAAFALAWAAARAPSVVAACWRHPVVLVPLALALWSAVVAPFAELPWLSLTGAPQSGYGALWHLDTALLIAAARLVRGDAALWRRLGYGACGAVAVVAALKTFDWVWEHNGGRHLLIWVASYYGWLGLALPVAVALPGQSRRRTVALLALGLVAVAASRSSAAVLGLLAGIAVAALMARRADGRRIGAAAVLGALALPSLAIAFLPQLRTVASMADRHSLLAMLWAEMSAWPAERWLTGLGWGRTQEVFHRHLQDSGMRLWDDSWIFMSSDYFHSHNGLSEALLAAGIPGVLLWLAWPLALATTAAPSRRPWAAGFAVGWALISVLWFPLALSVPLTAMAAAAVLPDVAAAELPEVEKGRARWPVLPLAAAGTMLAAVAGLLLQYGLAVSAVRADMAAWAAAPRPIPADPRGGDLAAAELIRDGFNALEKVPEAERARTLPVARMMAEYLNRRIPQTRSVLLPVTGLSLMAQVRVLQTLAWAGDDLTPRAATWGEWLDHAWRLAPGRSDLAIALFSQLAVHGRSDLLELGVRQVLQRDPRDPVGLYFAGLLAVQRPEPAAKQAGIDLLRASVDTGIERFMPLDPWLREFLGR